MPTTQISAGVLPPVLFGIVAHVAYVVVDMLFDEYCHSHALAKTLSTTEELHTIIGCSWCLIEDFCDLETGEEGRDLMFRQDCIRFGVN